MRHFCNCGCEDLTIKVANLMLNMMIWVLMTAVMLVCLYIIYDGLKVTQSAVLGEEILVYALADESVDFASLRDINSDIVGWIRIFGTEIDYPVMQSNDNDYYLARNYRQGFATAGSIFLDYRNNWQDNFLIIYGHRMSYGGMFTDIIKFKEQRFFEEHEFGELFIDGAKWKLDIVAFGLVRADDKMIYELSDGALREVMMRAIHVREMGRGRFLLLSTCDSQNKEMRDVLLARIVE